MFRVIDRDIPINSGEYKTAQNDDERVIRCGERQRGGDNDRVGKKSRDVTVRQTTEEMAEGCQREL